MTNNLMNDGIIETFVPLIQVGSDGEGVEGHP